MFRLSRESDRDGIRSLILSSFGVRDESLENLNGRYLLFFLDSGEIVGMTGLAWSDRLQGYEIDWSCVKPNYRKQGIMHDLISRICQFTDEKIYCYCWRLNETGEISMKSLMRDFHFQEVIHSCNGYKFRLNCHRNCIHSKRENCSCWEDLYERV